MNGRGLSCPLNNSAGGKIGISSNTNSRTKEKGVFYLDGGGVGPKRENPLGFFHADLVCPFRRRHRYRSISHQRREGRARLLDGGGRGRIRSTASDLNRRLSVLTTMKKLTILLIIAVTVFGVPADSWGRSAPLSCGKVLKTHSPKKAITSFRPGSRLRRCWRTPSFPHNLLTPAVAVLEDPAISLGEVVFPKGTKLVGQAAVLHSLDRVNIDFKTVVFRMGRRSMGIFWGCRWMGRRASPGKWKCKRCRRRQNRHEIRLAGVQVSAAAGVPTVESSIASASARRRPRVLTPLPPRPLRASPLKRGHP